MASMFSRTPTLIRPTRNRSTSIRFASPRVNCGVSRPRRATQSTSIFGTITLNQPEPETEPVFAEPWQAQAFALAVRLSEQGYFTWKEWSAALADELKMDETRGYYEHWLAALERLVTARGLTNEAALLERKEAWADAYRHTPHGKPVELLKEA
jgi:nitrile hydratase accessory protein